MAGVPLFASAYLVVGGSDQYQALILLILLLLSSYNSYFYPPPTQLPLNSYCSNSELHLDCCSTRTQLLFKSYSPQYQALILLILLLLSSYNSCSYPPPTQLPLNSYSNSEPQRTPSRHLFDSYSTPIQVLFASFSTPTQLLVTRNSHGTPTQLLFDSIPQLSFKSY